jgi:hypothetical protein
MKMKMKMTSLLAVAVWSIGGLAYADANIKKLCQDNVGLEKSRLAEIERTAHWVREALVNVRETEKARNASSALFTEKAQALSSTAGLLAGADREAFEEFSRADTVYAQHDKQIAEQSGAIAAALQKELDRLDEGIHGHQAHIQKVEAICKALK